MSDEVCKVCSWRGAHAPSCGEAEWNKPVVPKKESPAPVHRGFDVSDEEDAKPEKTEPGKRNYPHHSKR